MPLTSTVLRLLLAALCLAASSVQAQLHGAGAGFPAKAYERWAQRYERATGLQVSYQPTGAAEGLSQLAAHRVQFAGNDAPLASQETEIGTAVFMPYRWG
jgi:phosphate transport system substrate-binding protein